MPQSIRGLRRLTSRARMGSVPALLGVLALGACQSDATGPSEPEAPVNLAPVVESISVADDGYRKARLTGSVSDPEGDIASAVIDWGDGKSSDVSGDFGNISIQHRYDRAQDYTVTLTVTDGEGLFTQRSSSMSINVPDPACLDFFKIVGACVNGTLDLRNFEIEVRVLNKVIFSDEIREGEGDGELRIPFGLGIGAMTVKFDMDAGTVTFTGEYCVIPYLKCETMPSQTIRLKS